MAPSSQRPAPTDTLLNTNKKGANAERRARKLLEAAGYQCFRAAGSLGVVDLIAWDATSVRFVQVKSNCACSPAEKEQLALVTRPANCSVEIWRFKDRVKDPLIER